MIAKLSCVAALAAILAPADASAGVAAGFADPHLAAAPRLERRIGAHARWTCPVDMRAQPFPAPHGYRWGCVPWR